MKVMKSLVKGFTLIELMIVFAIIAIIAATFAPMIWPSEMQKARQERAVQEIRNPIQQQCINGSAYVVTPQGIQQTLSEAGTGVRCG